MSDKKEGPKTTISLSEGFLMPIEEKDHYGIFRNVIGRDDLGNYRVLSEIPMGPLMIYRKCARDEEEDMWTFDETTGTRIGLAKVWDGRDPDGQITPRKKK